MGRNFGGKLTLSVRRKKRTNSNIKEYLRCKSLGIPYTSKTPKRIKQDETTTLNKNIFEENLNLNTISEETFNESNIKIENDEIKPEQHFDNQPNDKQRGLSNIFHYNADEIKTEYRFENLSSDKQCGLPNTEDVDEIKVETTQCENQIATVCSINETQNEMKEVAHCSRLDEVEESELLKVLLIEKVINLGTQKVNTDAKNNSSKKKKKYRKISLRTRAKYLREYVRCKKMGIPYVSKAAKNIRENFAKLLLRKNCDEAQSNSKNIIEETSGSDINIEIKTEICDEEVQYNEHLAEESTLKENSTDHLSLLKNIKSELPESL